MMSSTIEVADDTETQVAQLAAGLEKSPAELRAMVWQKIADANIPMSVDVEEFYESLVDDIYMDAVGDDSADDDADLEAAASADSDFDIHAALNPWADHDVPLEAYGTGFAGDTMREEYLEREKQVDILSEALERADVRKDADGEDD